MNIQITTTRRAATMHGIKALIYGRAGAGKTFLARTAPQPIILSAEAGLLSLRDVELPVLQVRNVQDLSEYYAFLTTSEEAKAYNTIYIDSLTEIAEVVLANAKLSVKDPRQAYGEMIEKMSMTVRAYRDISEKHVVMVAKQESAVDEVTRATIHTASMPGTKLGNQLPYLFDEVFRLAIGVSPESGESFRYLQTAPDLQYEAKDRSGVLNAIEPPDLTHIFNKILSSTGA